MLEPWWRNFLYNMATVQLVHRAFFWLLAVPGSARLVAQPRHAGGPCAARRVRAAGASSGFRRCLLGVPVGLGAAHQGGAVLLLAAALWSAHSAGVWPALRPMHAAGLKCARLPPLPARSHICGRIRGWLPRMSVSARLCPVNLL